LALCSHLFVFLAAAFGVQFQNQMVTRTQPPQSGCSVPNAVSSFATTDARIYLYFEATVTNGDEISARWIQPDNNSAGITQWGRVTGSYCFTGAFLNIFGLPTSSLGSWRVQVLNNGSELFSIPFTVFDPTATSQPGPQPSGPFRKPVDAVKDYDGTFGGTGAGSVGYSVVYRDNENGAVCSPQEGCGSHPGVDIPVRAVPVYAIADGFIASETLAPCSGGSNVQNLSTDTWNCGWGKLVVVRHDNLPGTNEPVYSIYAHLSSYGDGAGNGLYIGKWIAKGTQVGTSGNTGNSIGQNGGWHLHFQLNRRTVNSSGRSGQVNIPWFPSNVSQPDSDDLVPLFTYNPMRFIQNAGGVSPTLYSVGPNVVQARTPAAMTLFGTDLDSGSSEAVVLTEVGGFVGNAAVVSRAKDQVQVKVVMNDPGTFLIGVRNPDGRVSAYLPFTVQSTSTTSFANLDDQARQDILQRASKDWRFGTPTSNILGSDAGWDPNWELRWITLNFSGSRQVTIYHATNKSSTSVRDTNFLDPDAGNWTGWERVP
jgi:murein DD-endopeptidase MepM/ murein hydrolase activator NlpD